MCCLTVVVQATNTNTADRASNCEVSPTLIQIVSRLRDPPQLQDPGFQGARPNEGMIKTVPIFRRNNIDNRLQPTRTVQAVFALAGDILITVALCWRLNSSKTGLQS